ncbi:hypothetical protein D3C72_1709560 [compost metagenome]
MMPGISTTNTTPRPTSTVRKVTATASSRGKRHFMRNTTAGFKVAPTRSAPSRIIQTSMRLIRPQATPATTKTPAVAAIAR